MMRLVGVVAAGCAVLALAGCSQDVAGQPEASGAPLTKEQLFDPCSVPDDVLLAAGADPASKDDNPFSVERAEWKGCSWKTPGYFLNFHSTTKTVQEFRENDYFHDFTDITVGDRLALQYLLGTRTPIDQCAIAFATSRGTVTLTAALFVNDKSGTDPCPLVNAAAADFVKVIPE
ncbi:DUF3558 domain-containing protein [Nocardia sp. NPDC059177]|uniref:DUF3558 domain-containing protein n=1 Tax=Nocardia sp. NPDC059177 TaxID=3346759 RepID=UPI00369C7903